MKCLRNCLIIGKKKNHAILDFIAATHLKIVETGMFTSKASPHLFTTVCTHLGLEEASGGWGGGLGVGGRCHSGPMENSSCSTILSCFC